MSGEAASPHLSLYYYDTCPFCVRVLRSAKHLGVELELRNIIDDRKHRDDLVKARGRGTVPVLRIEDGERDEWMPESRDIIRYLEQLAG